ncbi:lamin tail domain-containing protein [Rubripirellula reticaptiva]|uniref:LTD domain-containing protein n=1 Tax=Rubripirellula reticaptiva TaxID=2528013 RepID=A0A5C6EI25_9BACT|nr:lamin tail domain-containing protein [Rubripirellula reticaptiva]TWU48478.1 hypothetical protein Poly59_53260 [Rubripirellula reticaptiva]
MKFPFARQTRAAEPRLRSSKHRSELKSLIIEQLEAPLPTKKSPVRTRPPMPRVDAATPFPPRISRSPVSPTSSVTQTPALRPEISPLPVRRIDRATLAITDVTVLDSPKVTAKIVATAIEKSTIPDHQAPVFPFVAFAVTSEISSTASESATEFALNHFALNHASKHESLTLHHWSAVADINCPQSIKIDLTSSRLVSGFRLTANGSATWSAVTCSTVTQNDHDRIASDAAFMTDFIDASSRSANPSPATQSQERLHTLVPVHSRFAALGRRYLILPNRFSSRLLRNYFGRITATSSRVSMDQIDKVYTARASAKQIPAPKSELRIFNGEAAETVGRRTSQPSCHASVTNLRISEIDEYRNDEGGSVEYVELENFGTKTISLAGVALVDAVDFQFDTGKIDRLEPGEFALVVRDLSEMASTDGHDLPIAGQFEASKTNNDHATITVLAADGSIIQSYVRNPDNGTWQLPHAVNETSISLHRISNMAATRPAAESPNVTATTKKSDPTNENPHTAPRGVAQVVRRGVAYANAPSALGPIAIAANVTGLLPGQKATSANYTNYLRGLTQVFIDVDGLPSTHLSEEDFGFKVGNCEDLSAWQGAPSTSAIDVASGAGEKGASRVAITWADHAIQNQWLQVTMLASDATGLAMDDVFYVGHQSVRPTETHTTETSPTNRLLTPPPAAAEPFDAHGEALRMILAPAVNATTPTPSNSQKILTFSRRGPLQNPAVVDSIFSDKPVKTRLSRAE